MNKTSYVVMIVITFCFLLTTPFSAVAADSPDDLKWMPFNIPAEGKAGNWMLAKGSDIRHLTQAADGTLYCYANPAGTTYTLFKSADGGYSWSYTGNVEDVITAIATSPDNASNVYYTTASQVYRSIDGGNRFTMVVLNPGGAGSNNVTITSLDVAATGEGNIVVIGTRDADNLQYGGIYLLDESSSFNVTDADLGNYDVYDVSFSPQFATDRQLIAAVSDETSTFVTTRFGNEPWDQTTGRATITGLTPVSAAIALPDDYSAEPGNGQSIMFLAVNTGSGSGDVYRIEGRNAPLASTSRDLDAGLVTGLNNIDISGLAVSGTAGNATLLAGAAAEARAFISQDGGLNWRTSTRPPTGGSQTGVLFSRDYARSHIIYTFTSGTESAFSISRDFNATWNQLGLIDSEITSLRDLAISQDYGSDGTLYLITFGGKHSLWRTVNGGTSWERIFSSVPAHIDSFDKILLPPRYHGQTVIISGAGNGKPAMWKSSDSGQQFVQFAARDPVSGNTFNVDAWAIAGDDTLFIGSYDGSKGIIYRYDNNATIASSRATVGTISIHSIALSPGYEGERTILAGNTNGEVFLSVDNGTTFTGLPEQALPPLSDSITVTFDPAYQRNKTVYAASNGADKGIFRFIIERSTDWESIDGTLPTGAKINRILASEKGILYATNVQKVTAANNEGGIERTLNPAYPLGPKFETVIKGLKDNATLMGLWLSGDRLWAIDSANDKLVTYTDTLSGSVSLRSPADTAAGIGINNTVIDWDTVESATTYQWQLSYDDNFTGIPTGFEDNVSATSARLPALEQDTTYHWRVRVTEPVLSPWSEKRSFTTGLGTEVAACKLISPEPAEKGVPVQPVFQWSALAGAERYEVMVSTESSFNSPEILKIGDYAIPGTAWQCDVQLNYSTTYFWKTRAISADTNSPWSAVGAFTTEPPPRQTAVEQTPVPLPQPPLPPTTKLNSSPVPETPPPVVTFVSPPAPVSPPQTNSNQSLPEWAKPFLYMGGVFLFIVFSLLIIMILITIKIIRG